jgi:hypothetical protein
MNVLKGFSIDLVYLFAKKGYNKWLCKKEEYMILVPSQELFSADAFAYPGSLYVTVLSMIITPARGPTITFTPV